MAPQSKQVRLPFDKLTEKNLQPIVKKFQRHKIDVVSIDAPNRAKRESGYLLKDATFVFSDGQKMLIRVKSDGTVFQVKLNNKVVPIKAVDDMDKAVKELIAYVLDNAKAYERAKIQREKRRRLKIDAPSIVTSRQEKIKKYQEELNELTTSNNGLSTQLADKESSVNSLNSKLEAARADLAAEKEKTVALEKTLASLSA